MHPRILKLAFNQRDPLPHFLNFVRFRFPSANSGCFINSNTNWYQTSCSGQLLANSRTWDHLLDVCRSSRISCPCKYTPISRLTHGFESRSSLYLCFFGLYFHNCYCLNCVHSHDDHHALLLFSSFQINSVLFIFLLRRIGRVTKFREVNMVRANQVRAWIRRSAMLLPVLGITWSFGFLTFVSSTEVFHYLFTILNSLQGFFIFLTFCILDDRVSCQTLISFVVVNAFVFGTSGSP